MNTRLRIFILLALMLAGLAASAQYTGGNGRGDYMNQSGTMVLSGFDAMFSGGSGRGDHMALGSGLEISCVNPTNGGAIATAQTICSGGDPAAFTSTTPTGHIGTLEYKWQSSTTDATTEAGFSDISPSETSETFDPPTGLTTTTWYRRLARVTCETTWLKSNVVEITVNQTTKRYVTVVGAGSKNGLDWLNAYDGTQLQTAINESCVNEVWVAAGTYKPTTSFDRAISFVMKNGVAIYGGFSGSEINLTARNWTTNVTILSGDLAVNDGANFANYGDNSYHVISNNGLNSTAILDGFTIKGGNSDGLGGGMLNSTSSPSISNCTFSKNNAHANGGGMFNISSNPILSNCTFSANKTEIGSGGAMSNHTSSPSISNCTFIENTAPNGTGGGMDNFNSSPSISNCTFSANTAGDNGGGMNNFISNPILTNCIVWGNTGGGTQGIFNDGSTPTVTYSIIQGSDVYPGDYNLLDDPLFVDAANPAGSDGIFGTADDGISIQPGSPAINKGNPLTTTPATDITGYTRTGVFDIGAYEGLPCSNPSNGGTISANQEGCSPFDPTEITVTALTGNVGTLVYKWQSSTNNTTYTDLTTGTYSATTYNPDALTVTTWYKRLVKVTCASEWLTTTAIKVTVRPVFNAGSIQNTGETICYSGDPALIVGTAAIIDNGSIISSVGTGYGGNNVSVIRTGGNLLGFGNQQTAGNSVMDDFTLLTSKTINSIEFLGYQTGSTTTSTFTGLYFRIYDGEPGAGGNVIWGDFTTNRMTSTSFSNTYRVSSTTISNSTRPVMNIVCEGLTIPLNAGTYWLEWQATGTLGSGPWQPPTTSLTGNARHHLPDGYIALLDDGDGIGVELPFILRRIGSVDASGGVGTISYQWQSSTTEDFASPTVINTNDASYDPPSGLQATTWYRRQAKDEICNTNFTNSAEVWKVTVNPQLTATAINTVHVDCHSNNTGSVEVSVSGGTTNYEYAWSTEPIQTTALATGLTTGTYSVTVTDGNGCTATSSAIITQPNAPLTATAGVITHVNCYGNNNGSVNVSVAGGTTNYSYAWSTNPAQSAALATGLTSGTYSVTVTDGNGCKATSSALVTQPNAALTANAGVISHVNCYGNNNGSVNVSVSGGTTNYNYAWSTNPAQTAALATGLTTGTYSVTVTDGNGCSATSSATINQPNALTAAASVVANVSIYQGSDGSVTVSSGGGTTDYSYKWSTNPQQTTQAATGLSAGTYWVTVTDANSCTVTSSIAITQPTPPSTQVNTVLVTNVGSTQAEINWTRGDGDGSAVFMIQGTTGFAPPTNNVNYTPNPVFGSTGSKVGSTDWFCVFDGTGTNVIVTGLDPSTQYRVHICEYKIGSKTYNTSASTQNPANFTTYSALEATASIVENVSCNGLSNGTATVSASGGNPSYEYLWSTVPAQTAQTATGLLAGTYTVTVTDGVSATITSSVEITQPDVLEATATVTKAITCHQGSNGEITVSVSGGTTLYSYAWSTSPVQSAVTATGLSVGTYSVTVTDVNGCTTTSSTSITQPIQWWPELTGPTPVCQNSTSNVYTTDLGMTKYTWLVSTGGTITFGGTGADNTVTITWTDSGPRTVRVNYTTPDPAGCVAVAPKVKNVMVNVAPTPAITGEANVTQSQVVTYETAHNPGNTYTWNASHGNPELCFPYRNCLTLTWDFPCGIINPGYVRVTETNVTTGCSTTVTKWITITP